MVRATELLLQERVPTEVPLAELQPDDAVQTTFHEIPTQLSRRDDAAYRVAVHAHPGECPVLGHGHGERLGLQLGPRSGRHRARAKTAPATASASSFIVRDVTTSRTWSAGYQPLLAEPDSYEVTFATDKVEFHRRDGKIETHMEITVSPEHHAEVRRLTIRRTTTTAARYRIDQLCRNRAAASGDGRGPSGLRQTVPRDGVRDRQRGLLCRRGLVHRNKNRCGAFMSRGGRPRDSGHPDCETDRVAFGPGPNGRLGRRRWSQAPLVVGNGRSGARSDPELRRDIAWRRRVRAGRLHHGAGRFTRGRPGRWPTRARISTACIVPLIGVGWHRGRAAATALDRRGNAPLSTLGRAPFFAGKACEKRLGPGGQESARADRSMATGSVRRFADRPRPDCRGGRAALVGQVWRRSTFGGSRACPPIW